jgi:hypothetical protein
VPEFGLYNSEPQAQVREYLGKLAGNVSHQVALGYGSKRNHTQNPDLK